MPGFCGLSLMHFHLSLSSEPMKQHRLRVAKIVRVSLHIFGHSRARNTLSIFSASYRTACYSCKFPPGTQLCSYSLRAFLPSSISSNVLGQSALSKRDSERSASNRPPVWHFAQ